MKRKRKKTRNMKRTKEEEDEKKNTRKRTKGRGKGTRKGREDKKREHVFLGRRKVRKQNLKTKTVGKSFLTRSAEEAKSND